MSHTPQPLPRPGHEDVTPALIADLEARAAEGLKTYGRRLQTFNGRSAVQDALEEALDLAQYLKQLALEQSAENQNRFRRVKVTMPVCCHACYRMVPASEDDLRWVILEEAEETVSIFCCLPCANLPDAVPLDNAEEVREHKGTRPWVDNGKSSSILLLCDECGRGFDPMWQTSREGCGGATSAEVWKVRTSGQVMPPGVSVHTQIVPGLAPEPVAAFKSRVYVCKECGEAYDPEWKSACAAGLCRGPRVAGPKTIAATLRDCPHGQPFGVHCMRCRGLTVGA